MPPNASMLRLARRPRLSRSQLSWLPWGRRLASAVAPNCAGQSSRDRGRRQFFQAQGRRRLAHAGLRRHRPGARCGCDSDAASQQLDLDALAAFGALQNGKARALRDGHRLDGRNQGQEKQRKKTALSRAHGDLSIKIRVVRAKSGLVGRFGPLLAATSEGRRNGRRSASGGRRNRGVSAFGRSSSTAPNSPASHASDA